MKKNGISVVALAISVLNLILTAVIIFALVPSTINTNNLINKVASSIDFEVESLKNTHNVSDIKIEDLETLPIEGDITVNLRDTQGKKNYALLSVSLSVNTKSSDYSALIDKIKGNEAMITEVIRDEFSKYTRSEALEYKDIIKDDIILELEKHFNSDIIVGISLGKFIVE